MVCASIVPNIHVAPRQARSFGGVVYSVHASDRYHPTSRYRNPSEIPYLSTQSLTPSWHSKLSQTSKESRKKKEEPTNMINAFLVFNGQGQPRLTKFYTQLVSQFAMQYSWYSDVANAADASVGH